MRLAEGDHLGTEFFHGHQEILGVRALALFCSFALFCGHFEDPIHASGKLRSHDVCAHRTEDPGDFEALRAREMAETFARQILRSSMTLFLFGLVRTGPGGLGFQ